MKKKFISRKEFGIDQEQLEKLTYRPYKMWISMGQIVIELGYLSTFAFKISFEKHK